jgi:hypothetical protein
VDAKPVFYVNALRVEPVSTLPSLEHVTLCCIDCVNHELAIAALAQCVQKCTFGRALFITDRDFTLPDIDVIRIDPLQSRDAYSHFVVKELGACITTSHALLIQWDGFVVNPLAWSDEFLDYDYIGARWGWPTDGHTVGNGGFSLRSKRLLDALRDRHIADIAIEDVAICRRYRAYLEAEHAIRFAPEPVADRFAFETTYPTGLPFGFHGLFNFWLFFQQRDLEAFLAMATPAILGSIQCLRLAQNLADLKRFDEARLVAGQILRAHPRQAEAGALLRTLEHPVAAVAPPAATSATRAVGRNDPCPCGSGKRYKLCHGALVS